MGSTTLLKRRRNRRKVLIKTVDAHVGLVYEPVYMTDSAVSIPLALPQNLWVASVIRFCFHRRILGDLADFLGVDCDGEFQRDEKACFSGR